MLLCYNYFDFLLNIFNKSGSQNFYTSCPRRPAIPMSRSKLSDFKLDSKLGSGSFGTVYKAIRLRDNITYVIKKIEIGELTATEQMDAINEVKLLASVNSNNVVQYFDSFVESDVLYIVMEYCDKGDLKQLLKRRKSKTTNEKYQSLDSDRTWSLFLQVSDRSERALRKTRNIYEPLLNYNYNYNYNLTPITYFQFVRLARLPPPCSIKNAHNLASLGAGADLPGPLRHPPPQRPPS